MWVSLSPRSCGDVSGTAASSVLNFDLFPFSFRWALPSEILLSPEDGRTDGLLEADPLSGLAGSDGSDGHLCSLVVVAHDLRLHGGQCVSSTAMEVYGAVRNRAQPSGERDPHPSSALIPWGGPPAFTSSSLALRSCGSCPPSERVARVPSLLSGLWKHY